MKLRRSAVRSERPVAPAEDRSTWREALDDRPMMQSASPVQQKDNPRLAYGVLERRATITTIAILLGLAGLAWWSTLGTARGMSSMVQGFAHVGTAMPFATGAPLFVAMWTTMMVAMMFPTIAPIVLLHRMVLRRRGEGIVSTVAFGAGYLAIWASVGVLPLAVLIGFRHVAHASAWIDRAGGGVILLAGAYQFTDWKQTCLRACRSPLTFLATHDFGRGSAGAFRAGVSHGLYCLGCCWALMAVLFVVGLMNLTWMAAIAVVFLAEKNWRRGVGLTKVVGTVVLAFGIAVLIHPSLLG
jgi:predicted metal-binding membrane protein